MKLLAHIQYRLQEEISDLCEACIAEQEWLEEGDHCLPAPGGHHDVNRANSTDGKESASAEG